MEETVFFNLGNAIASNPDPKELIKEAQYVQDNRQPIGKMVIVEGSSGEHLLFDLSDQEKPSPATVAYKVTQIIE